jgi:cell filamentation protein
MDSRTTARAHPVNLQKGIISIVSLDPYVIPGTTVLRNKLDITNQLELDRAERLLVVQRTLEGPPKGRFDLAHLKSIHRHLFQDVYDWAGELRTVEISKEGHSFQFIRFIDTGMADVHRRLVTSSFLKGLSEQDFSEQAAKIIGDVNYVHPFREGNGRTQLEYLRQLASASGHHFDPDLLDPNTWQSASRLSHDGNYGAIAKAILEQGMVSTKESQERMEKQRAQHRAAWEARNKGRGF